MHAFSKLYHADLVCPSKGQTSVVLSSIFCLNPVLNVYSTTLMEVLLELSLLTSNPSLLALKIYGKANSFKMLTDVDHDNLRTVPPILIHFRSPESFPPFFEKSFNYDTKFVYFLTKTFSYYYLCCFCLKNVVSTSN